MTDVKCGLLDDIRLMATVHRASTRVGPLQAVILLLVAVTALVHLYMGVATSMLVASAGAAGGLLTVFAVFFFLNFAGYVVLGTALYLPALARFQPVIRGVLAVYAAVTIACYFIFAPPGNPIGLPDKVVEIVLIGLLVIDGYRARQASARPSLSG